ncbi:MAG: type VI secretion system-associated protein TagF [Burkholderiales bacterium]|nr:type VI secretion system-associated protein TagF [Burkholderiales bacterium]
MSRELSMDQPGETGFYGKIPSQGDFVSRRLAQDFIQQWDDWLQACLAHNRSAFGARWEGLYREAPVWRFLLAPGTCGASAWAGLVQPSVDRVGRYFPLTVAAELPSDIEVLDTMGAASGWYERVEHAAAAAFDAEVQLDAFDRSLQALSFPAAALVRADAADDTLPLAERSVTAFKVAAGSNDGLSDARAILREEQVNVGHRHCVWFNASAQASERVLLVTRALPDAQLSCAFFDGGWRKFGWDSSKADAVSSD